MPCVLESYKTYDDNVLIKTADIGQVWCSQCVWHLWYNHTNVLVMYVILMFSLSMTSNIYKNGMPQMILVREEKDPVPENIEYRHGLTPPMRDARKRRFRREPDLNVFSFLLYNSAFIFLMCVLQIFWKSWYSYYQGYYCFTAWGCPESGARFD